MTRDASEPLGGRRAGEDQGACWNGRWHNTELRVDPMGRTSHAGNLHYRRHAEHQQRGEVKASHSITVPPPYSPFGIVPSKSP